MIAFLTLLVLAFAAGVYYRRHSVMSGAARARSDRRADRVLPASWEQLADLDCLAGHVAQHDGRASDQVLAQYGAYTYARGTPGAGMVRRKLTRAEASRITEEIKRTEGVKLEAPTLGDWRERNAIDHSDEIPL